MKSFLFPVVIWAAIAAALIYFGNKLFSTKTLSAGAKAIKSGVDEVVSTATGREESLGGAIAEWLDPNTRLVRQMLKDPVTVPVKPAAQTPQTRELKPVSSWWEFWK